MTLPGSVRSIRPVINRVLGLAFSVLWISFIIEYLIYGYLSSVLYSAHWLFLILLGLSLGFSLSFKIKWLKSSWYLQVALCIFLVNSAFFAWLGNSQIKYINTCDICLHDSLIPVIIKQINQWSVVCIVLVVFASVFIGIWIKQKKWLEDYHFKYSILRFWFLLSLGALALWFMLHSFGVYKWALQTILGCIIFVIDYFIIQFILTYILLFMMVYLDNFKWGMKLLRFFENGGKTGTCR